MATELMTEREAAERLDVHRVTLAVWRHEGRGPAYVKIGRNIRYRSADIDRYLEEQTVRPAS